MSRIKTKIANSRAPAAADLADFASRRLLVDRKTASELIGGISTSTVIRLEAAGKLRAVKLTPKPQGRTFYYSTDILALISSTDS